VFRPQAIDRTYCPRKRWLANYLRRTILSHIICQQNRTVENADKWRKRAIALFSWDKEIEAPKIVKPFWFGAEMKNDNGVVTFKIPKFALSKWNGPSYELYLETHLPKLIPFLKTLLRGEPT
jgi:hypothetical protein